MIHVRIELGFSLLAMCVVPAVFLPADQLSYARYGDINLGGLFPFHFGNCESVPNTWSLQLGQAMVFAIEEVNNRSDLLPNINLGFDIRDSCFHEDFALWSALSLMQVDATRPSVANSSQDLSEKVIGIVGPVMSTVSIIVGAVADLFSVPMVAVGATSDELSDKGRFPYFLRTVPPDSLQAQAMVDIISYMGWKYVSIIYLADTYGIRGAHALVGLAESRGICVARSLPVQRTPTSSELQGISLSLKEAKKARVLVVFASQDTADLIVEAVENENGKGHFIWFGSESWTHGISPPTSVPPTGSLFLGLHNPEPQGFFDFLSGLQRSDIADNPWFEHYLMNWETQHNCTVWVDERCGMPHLEQYNQGSFMSPVIDAVYAFAYAIHSFMNSSDIGTLNGDELLDYLKHVSFTGARGQVEFNSLGDMEGKYLVHNARVVDGEFLLTVVGLWDATAPPERRLTLYQGVIWPSGSTEVPASTCVDVCQAGYRLAPLEEKCCFGCFQCEAYAVVVNNTECMDCEETEWPDEDRLSCIPIIPKVTDWTDTLHLSILILSCVGFFLAGLIAFGMTVYRNHSVIKATSRELSAVNVIGLFLAFVSTFLLLSNPTSATCCLSKSLVSLSFTLTYAPTLLKVSRIYRIFRAGKKSAGRPRFISPSVQLFMVFVLILIQVICIILTSVLSHCEPKPLFSIPRDNHLELYCELSTGFLVSCAYNLLIILACCIFAFLARKVPDNYNESKFIGVSVYSTLLACLAAIPVYLTSRDASQKVASICLAVLLNAYLTAVCVYVPKLYAIKFMAAEVDRSNATRANMSTLQSSNNRVQPCSSTGNEKAL